MKKNRFFPIIALAILLLAGPLAAGATTKTVTYTMTSFESSPAGAYDMVLTRSGDTFGEATSTYTCYVQENSIYPKSGAGHIILNLADGFHLSIQWSEGSNVSVINHCFYPTAAGKQITYTVSCEGYYVTNVKMTGGEGTWSNTDYDSEWDLSESHTTSSSFGSFTVTYTDTPTLSVFESAGENAYKIKDKTDLFHLANYVNIGKNPCTGLTFLQTQDITCDATYKTIGYKLSDSDKADFRGTYDGGNFTISGITVSRTGNTGANDYVGLFGFVGYNTASDYGTVRSIALANSTFTGHNSVGGIVGYNRGIVENCRVEGTVTIGTDANDAMYHGGIVGHNDSNGIIEGCFSGATVTSGDKDNCKNYGGIAGYAYTHTIIRNNIAVGATVSGYSNKGVIAGIFSGTLANNYYYNCTVSSFTTDIGVAHKDITNNDGAVRGVPYIFKPAEIGAQTAAYTGGLTAYEHGLAYRGVYYMHYDAPVSTAVLPLVQGAKDGVSAYWGTFYDGTHRYTLPAGAAAYTMGSDYKLYRLGTDGRTIPADVAVVIIATSAEVILTQVDGSSAVTDHAPGVGNILHGSDSPVALDDSGKVPVPGSNPATTGKAYVLSATGTPVSIAFHRFTAAAIPAGKAYYVVTQ